MSDSPSREDLRRDLARRIQEIEANEDAYQRLPAFSLGIAALDDCLPRRRLRAGSLVELLAATEGASVWTLALVMAGAVSGSRLSSPLPEDRETCLEAEGGVGKVIVVGDVQSRFYPPAASRWGLDLRRLILLRPASVREEEIAIGQALRCRAVGAVISWHSRLRTLDFRRLQAAAEAGGVIGFLLRPAQAQREPSFAALRLLVTPMPEAEAARRVRIDVLRCRGGKCRSFVLEIDDETGHVRVPARLAAPAAGARAARTSG